MFFRKMFAIGLLLLLGACSQEEASIYPADLTEREEAILDMMAVPSFMFDFEAPDDDGEVSVWMEHYQSGRLENDRFLDLTAPVAQNGFVTFVSNVHDTDGIQLFRLGINSDGDSTASSFAMESDHLERMSGTWEAVQEERRWEAGEEIMLAYIGFSSNHHMSSLSTDFFEDPDNHLDELEQYDDAYVLKAKREK
ncbi:hypothetical protein [Bhargavaea beijingensis]|uniref:Uncharacterized protein n=1 Tax=Bhargavaea beijingensis TaxID=426756 RepID=A0ABX9ZCT5_9BACL|nr:hypothetical protein [Bhargavaea beijingensis]RSK31940.1 hypothetical protein EJA12_08115 [Bhargavaea beijingensis]